MPHTLHHVFIPTLWDGPLGACPILHTHARICMHVRACRCVCVYLHKRAGEYGWVGTCAWRPEDSLLSYWSSVPSSCFCCFVLLAETVSHRPGTQQGGYAGYRVNPRDLPVSTSQTLGLKQAHATTTPVFLFFNEVTGDHTQALLLAGPAPCSLNYFPNPLDTYFKRKWSPRNTLVLQ